jgi:hypothetical protein
MNNQNSQKFLAEELLTLRIQLEHAVGQLEYVIANMEADLIECDCEDGCCK